jgi:hypothetical protein
MLLRADVVMTDPCEVVLQADPSHLHNYGEAWRVAQRTNRPYIVRGDAQPSNGK